jgi:hypothetical protein
MPISIWQKMMDHHYPNSAFISLERGVFDRLYEYKRSAGVSSWEQVIDKLLAQKTEAAATEAET